MDKNGKPVSLQDLAQQMADKQNELAQANQDYASSKAYWKMGITLGPIIAVTTVATGGAAAAGWGTLATAATVGFATGVTEYTINTIEAKTSNTGNTAEVREANIKNAVIDGLLAATGYGAAKASEYINLGIKAGAEGEILLNQGLNIQTRAVRALTMLANDLGSGMLAEWIQTGSISVEGTVMNGAFSAVGNIAALLNKGSADIHKAMIPDKSVPYHRTVKFDDLSVGKATTIDAGTVKFNAVRANNGEISVKIGKNGAVTLPEGAQLKQDGVFLFNMNGELHVLDGLEMNRSMTAKMGKTFYTGGRTVKVGDEYVPHNILFEEGQYIKVGDNLVTNVNGKPVKISASASQAAWTELMPIITDKRFCTGRGKIAAKDACKIIEDNPKAAQIFKKLYGDDIFEKVKDSKTLSDFTLNYKDKNNINIDSPDGRSWKITNVNDLANFYNASVSIEQEMRNFIKSRFKSSASAQKILSNNKALREYTSIPENGYTRKMWTSNKGNLDLTVDGETRQIMAMYMDSCKDLKIDWSSKSNIDGMSKLDVLASIAKYTQEKCSAHIYMQNPEPTKIMVSELMKYDARTLEVAMPYKTNSWYCAEPMSGTDIDFLYEQFSIATGRKKGFIEKNRRFKFLHKSSDVERILNVNQLTEALSNNQIKIGANTIYRGEQFYGTLNLSKLKSDYKYGSVKIDAGTKLGDAVNTIMTSNISQKQKIDAISDILLGQAIVNNRFSSTTMSKTLAYNWAQGNKIGGGKVSDFSIVWKWQSKDGHVNGMFLEGSNIRGNGYYEQFELLIQRNTLVSINDVNIVNTDRGTVIELSANIKHMPVKPLKYLDMDIPGTDMKVSDLFTTPAKPGEKPELKPEYSKEIREGVTKADELIFLAIEAYKKGISSG